MSTPEPTPVTLKRTKRANWVHRLVRLCLGDSYKRGFAAGRAVVQWRNEQTIRELRQHDECIEKCYRLNLAELEAEVLRRVEAERKLKECRRHLRAANKGAERNALVAQLCAARAVIRSGLPNTQGHLSQPGSSVVAKKDSESHGN